MKGYVEQLDHLGYVLPQDLSVGLILNGLTSDFAGFVRNYNMHNMGKTVGELHALLIEYEKGLPKKAATPQVMAIQGGRIQKANKKSLNAKGKGKGKGKGNDKSYICKPKNPKPSAKGHPIKDDTCHHYKEVGHYKRNCHAYLAELIKKKKQVGTASSLDIFLTPPYTPQFSVVSERRNRTLLDMVRSMMNLTTLLLFFWYYALESATRILDMVPTKKVWGWEALMKRDTPDKLQQRSKSVGGVVELEEIQDEDTSPSKKTSKIPMEVEGFEPPREELIRVHRSVRTHRASECLCLNVEVEEHKMQSMKDNQVWLLVDLPPNCKTIRSKWLFKKKTDMDGNVHTYKARLIAKGFTQTNGVNYVETFSPVADIIAIRILIAIAVFYDYKIWQMDVKTAFLNGKYAIFKDSFMVLSKHQGGGIKDLMRKSKEAEYIAASEAKMEVVWIRKFFSRLGIVPTIDEPIKMFCDNSAALLIANEPGVHMGSRHYHRRYLLQVHTDNNLANPFMKALLKGKLTQHARSMRLCLASSFL
ncbi:retrotransposon protein, putative, ty1-copia subclass [Tanacetum coccineum]|uniref:Retrotransposon protein, putative, ty1-copia subclass n=1 Tax=Tanacetum coccineum TaxID=301880 RepID=A0ABQ4XPV2_9ASTR